MLYISSNGSSENLGVSKELRSPDQCFMIRKRSVIYVYCNSQELQDGADEEGFFQPNFKLITFLKARMSKKQTGALVKVLGAGRAKAF